MMIKMAAPFRGRFFSTCMLSKSLFPALSSKYVLRNQQNIIRKLCSSSSYSAAEGIYTEDHEKLFLRSDVQKLLHKISGFDLEKINRPKHQQLMKKPKYRLLTDKQLNEVREEAVERATTRLQMPPVMKCRKSGHNILVKDDKLIGNEQSKLVFTDITYGVSDRDRIIVVRDIDGTLRTANHEERDRIIQMYFPADGRKLRMPHMFEDTYLQSILNEHRYEYVLDRAIVQFEPDDPNYIRVTQAVYEHVYSTRLFDSLRSTRHFGGMVFYFARFKKIENTVIDMLKHDLLEDAVGAIKLYHILNPDVQSALQVKEGNVSDNLDILKIYTKLDTESRAKAELELLIQSYEEIAQQSKV